MGNWDMSLGLDILHPNGIVLEMVEHLSVQLRLKG